MNQTYLELSMVCMSFKTRSGPFQALSDVNLRILKALREANIDIPYPQRVVHLQPASDR